MGKSQCPSCGKVANYAFTRDDNQRYCKSHSEDGMTDVMSKKCVECAKQPRFGFEQKKPTHCKSHAKDGMWNVLAKKCAECGKQPSFGVEQMKPTHCATHATKDMQDVVNKMCETCGKKQASYNFEGLKPAFCTACATKGMFDIRSPRCVECKKQPCYGLNPKKPTHCAEHALDGMKNVKSKRCIECPKIPHYGLVQGNATHCARHATKNMWDVLGKRCVEEACDTRPTYGLEPKTPTHCTKHKLDGMKDVVHLICPDCETIATFGLKWRRPTHCSKHASKRMTDVVNKRCNNCAMTTVNDKYKPNCAQCHFYLHPDDPRIINFKTKEAAIMNVVENAYSRIILDSRVKGGSSGRRPDGYIDLKTHVVIVEVDENEHKTYDKICENRRIMELYQDFSNLNLVIIRINPDSYTKDGKRIKGAFSLSKIDGRLKSNEKELTRRCEDLLDLMKYHTTHVPDRAITIEYLFFSED